jgi:hypothetical protein
MHVLSASARSMKRKEKNVNHEFDELAKGLANGMSRREALRRVGLALGGSFLASLGLAGGANGQHGGGGGNTMRGGHSQACQDACQTAYHAGDISDTHACYDACVFCNQPGEIFCISSTLGGTFTCCSTSQICSSTGTCT